MCVHVHLYHWLRLATPAAPTSDTFNSSTARTQLSGSAHEALTWWCLISGQRSKWSDMDKIFWNTSTVCETLNCKSILFQHSFTVMICAVCCLPMDVTYEIRSRVPDQSRSFVWRLPLGISTRIDVHMMYIQRYYTMTQGKAETNSINAMSRTTIQTNTLSAIHHNNWHMSWIKELWFHHVSPTLMSYWKNNQVQNLLLH